MPKYQMYIDGKYVDSSSRKWLDSCNPYTGAVTGNPFVMR